MAAKKEQAPVPSEKIALYDKLIATNSEIERKGASMLYTSINGNMFSFLSKDGSLGLRLSKEDRDAFIRKYNAALFEQHGIVLKEYVEVPEELFNNTKALKKYFDLSYKFVQSLKPKPTKKK